IWTLSKCSDCYNSFQRTRKEKREEDAVERREIQLLNEKAKGESDAKKLVAEPHSFVIHRGKVGRYIRRLELDLRSVMEPFTATKLRELRRNNLKDFLVNGAVLGVTHLMVLTRGEQSLTLRIIRSPQGPTLSFKIMRYTLSRDIITSQRRSLHFQRQFTTAPLVVMNGFTGCAKKHVQLTQTMFQNMFPSINMKLSQVRRCVMVNYDAENDSIDIRHYAIKAVPTGLSKAAKKLVQGKIPDLSKYKDISDFFLNPGQMSESEFEGEQKEVKLAEDLTTRGCKAGQRTNIRLIELGPRLTLTLVKVEEGVDEGEVLYHSYMQKSAKELMKLRQNLPKKKKLKERQRKENEHRVIRRLKAVADRKAAEEEAIEEEKQKLINKQKAVTGEEYDERANETVGQGQNEHATIASRSSHLQQHSHSGEGNANKTVLGTRHKHTLSSETIKRKRYE
ncbi:unnamed protein product, partial [Anisakis simplex]|uniref:Protein Peter pan (inferred by orthology to a D. melanogaster protein) n=1 Tax=Anisakis simplex TaxID=6269 RepID=A0A0M3JQX2_ANISI